MLVPAALLVAAAWWVGWLDGIGRLSLGAPPFIGAWEWSPFTDVLPALLIGTSLVVLLPVAAARIPWRPLLLLGWAASAILAVSLAATDGRGAVSEPLATGFEYRVVLPEIEQRGPSDFADDFVERLPGYPTHVRGHPVGMPLAFWAHEQMGLEGEEWSAALVILAGTSAVVSTAVTVRLVVGEHAARRALPFLAVTPSLLWVATSADALVAGVVAAAVAAFAAAATRAGGARAGAWAVLAGMLGAVALHLSYGAVLMLAPMLVLAVANRRPVAVLGAVLGAATVTSFFLLGGFWWFEGLDATRTEYAAGAGGFRPRWYFSLLGNPAAFIAAIGPAVLVAMVRLRDARLWLVAGGALAGVVLANLSGLSKGEVERIWLPFVPFLTTSAAALPQPSVRWWLAAQAGTAIVLQLALDSPW